MAEFLLYVNLGLNHIADLNAFDHLVFLLALSASFKPKQWKNLFILITAFTIGHSATLVLATFKLIAIPSEIIEFLIPVTILVTSLFNISSLEKANTSESVNQKSFRFNYFLALFFGLIHGMGFSGYLQHLLGKETSIVLPLFSFNVGIEIGQIIIVSLFFAILFFAETLMKVKHRDWTLYISGIASGISIILLTETAFW
ncbi:MAG: HupE/UreJ family protein [Bacteroidetes bacterium]|nr:HupE/UreJ family protein [Bacteroidota bacterium]